MIKNVDLEKYEIGNWDLATENTETITWVWMQLMGEKTEKGDTLDYFDRQEWQHSIVRRRIT